MYCGSVAIGPLKWAATWPDFIGTKWSERRDEWLAEDMSDAGLPAELEKLSF